MAKDVMARAAASTAAGAAFELLGKGLELQHLVSTVSHGELDRDLLALTGAEQPLPDRGRERHLARVEVDEIPGRDREGVLVATGLVQHGDPRAEAHLVVG